MPHVVAEKQKLLNRVRRLRGQVEALERALDAEVECIQIMQQLTAARGAISSLMAEVVEDHIRMHMLDPDRQPTVGEAEAAEQLVSVMHSYIK
jgi:DNA-binding FrmR family transcriptional regulator